MPDDNPEYREERYRFMGPDQTDAEAFFTGVLNSLFEHVAVIEKDGIIIAVNEAWRSFARRNDARSALDVSEGANYLEVCRRVTDEDSEYASTALTGMQQVINGEKEIFTMEYPCSSPTEERWFLMTVLPMMRPEGGAVVSHTNITRRKIAEDELRRSEQHLRESREEYRALSLKLMTAREDSSRRLARELHDSLGQRLALISMLAARIDIDSSLDEKSSEGLKRIQAEMSRLSGDVHDIATQLHPRIIEDLGLADAVASYCKSFVDNEGIHVNFDSGEIPPALPRETALNLYRIIQESLSNIIKHAEATRVRIALGTEGNSIRLSVEDDGVGFDLEAIKSKKRLGLVSIRERAILIGGDVTITSNSGSGTTVTVEVPFGGDQ